MNRSCRVVKHHRDEEEKELTSVIPNFSGLGVTEDYREWEEKLDHFFLRHGISGIDKVEIVSAKLTEKASRWWRRVNVDQRECGEEAINSWSVMKRLMRGRYAPTSTRIALSSLSPSRPGRNCTNNMRSQQSDFQADLQDIIDRINSLPKCLGSVDLQASSVSGIVGFAEKTVAEDSKSLGERTKEIDTLREEGTIFPMELLYRAEITPLNTPETQSGEAGASEEEFYKSAESEDLVDREASLVNISEVQEALIRERGVQDSALLNFLLPSTVPTHSGKLPKELSSQNQKERR